MKVCVVGSGPWPLEKGAVVTGPSIRLRQFVEPLTEGRHDVGVVMLEGARRRRVDIPRTLFAEAFDPEEILQPERLAAETDLSFIGAVFGVGSLMPAVAAVRLAAHVGVPCWVDIFGDPLSELHAAQLRQGGEIDGVARDHIWKLYREILLRGDMFSTVSMPQRHALMGQLGLLGRFANHWDVCDRLHEIPIGVPEEWAELVARPPFPGVLREHGLNEKSRYIFFGGSWNVWLDEVAMGRAIAAALAEDPQLFFVCCGIPTGPAGEQVRQTLFQELGAARLAARVVELVPQHLEAESALLAWAGACISLDRSIPESELGGRNRLLPMVRWGARPVVSMKTGTETVLVAAGLAAGIFEGQWERAARELLAACHRSADRREEDRRAGVEWLRSATFSRTLEPVLTWIAAGAPRWPPSPCDGMVDRWAAFPADPERLFEKDNKKRRGWSLW
jgi:hypothetical protein